MSDTKPQSTILTIKPNLLEEIVKNYVRDLQIEAEVGEFPARSVETCFKCNEDWEDVEVPSVQVSIYF